MWQGVGSYNMLPSLGKLSLTPTGKFYALSEQEASGLNANNGKEALTFDEYKPNRERGQEGATFRLYWDQKRVLKNPPGHRTTEELEAHKQSLYAVYDARALWEWVKTHEKDPTNSFQIGYEDWMQLYAEYGNFGLIPEFVSRLPSLAWPDFGPDAVWVYEESGVHQRSNTPWTGGAWKATVDGALRFGTFVNFTENSQKPDFQPTNGLYFVGPPGEERIIKARYGKNTDYFTGPRDREQIYKAHMSKGYMRFYAMDEEPRASRYRTQPEEFSERAHGRLVKITSDDGLAVWHYAGPKKHERLVYSERDRTSATGRHRWVEHIHFTGRRGRERMYKLVRFQRGQHGINDIDTHYLRGAKGVEHVYKRVSGNGRWVAYYETGEEHRQALRRLESVVRMREDGGSPSRNRFNAPGPYEGPVYTRKSTSYFEGPRDAETRVRTESQSTGPDGYASQIEIELPEDDPERVERVRLLEGSIIERYSAFASVMLLVDTGALEPEYDEEDLEEDSDEEME